MKNKLSLNYLILFHNFCENSYCGHSFKEQSLSKIKLAIVWNCIQFLVILVDMFIELISRINNTNNTLPKKSIGLKIVTDSIVSSYFLLTALHLVLLINSRKILSSIRESQNRKIFFPIGKE